MSALPAHAIGPRLCRNDGMDGLRAQALAEIDDHLDNLKRCIHWLVAQGVSIIDVEMSRGRHLPYIKVAASPWLHTLFLGDCAATQRLQEGDLAVTTWKSNRYGCVVLWEEVTA